MHLLFLNDPLSMFAVFRSRFALMPAGILDHRPKITPDIYQAAEIPIMDFDVCNSAGHLRNMMFPGEAPLSTTCTVCNFVYERQTLANLAVPGTAYMYNPLVYSHCVTMHAAWL